MAEFLMMVTLMKRIPPPIKSKPVGRKPISFELKAWYDLANEGTVAELRDRWSEF
jgi:hypothetical protein